MTALGIIGLILGIIVMIVFAYWGLNAVPLSLLAGAWEISPVSRCVKPKRACLMRKNVFCLLNITPKSVKFPCSN